MKINKQKLKESVKIILCFIDVENNNEKTFVEFEKNEVTDTIIDKIKNDSTIYDITYYDKNGNDYIETN